MEILGIGPSELVFVIIIALIVLGPKDMQKAGKSIGRWLNDLVKSDGWKVFQQTSREIRNLPTNLMREANMDMNEAEKDIRKAMDIQLDHPASSPSRNQPQPQQTENSIQPAPATPAVQAVVPGEASRQDGAENTSDVRTPDQNA